MKYALIRINLIFFLLIFIIPNIISAESKTFVKEYTYQASEFDSKVSSRILALEQVKRLLLEELGTYIESHTEVVNFQLTKDQITALTAGIVQTQILNEKWDGERYWMRAKIEADPSEVFKSIDYLRKDHEKTKDLEEIRKRSDDLLKENEKLRKELAGAKGRIRQEKKIDYDKTIKGFKAIEWCDKGRAFGISGKYKDAIKAFNKAIEIDPKFAKAYHNRGVVYNHLGKYIKAIKNYDKAIDLNPTYTLAYYNRGDNYKELGNYSQAIKDYNKAIELEPEMVLAYNTRGSTYLRLGNYNQAIKDLDKAIELNPKNANAYENRGDAYSKVDNFRQAIEEYNKAIELNPILSSAYYGRGNAYGRLGDDLKKTHDLKIAARLGDKEAQTSLSEQGINW